MSSIKETKSKINIKLYKILVYIALIVLAVSIIIPVAWVFMASLKSNAEFVGKDINPFAFPKKLIWENFSLAFGKAKMGEYLLNSVIVTSLALIISLIVALPAAYCLARFEFKGRKFISAGFMVGLFVNVNYIVVPIFLMLSSANRTLGINFFLNNRLVLAIVYASTSLPFTIYLLSGYFRTLPTAYEEAALIDGCGYFKTMIKIMIPMARPSIITVILFNFLAYWNEYIIAFTLMASRNKTLPVGLQNLMAVEKTATNYGIMYAGLVIVMLPTLILYISVQKKLTQGMSLGGLKD